MQKCCTMSARQTACYSSPSEEQAKRSALRDEPCCASRCRPWRLCERSTSWAAAVWSRGSTESGGVCVVDERSAAKAAKVVGEVDSRFGNFLLSWQASVRHPLHPHLFTQRRRWTSLKRLHRPRRLAPSLCGSQTTQSDRNRQPEGRYSPSTETTMLQLTTMTTTATTHTDTAPHGRPPHHPLLRAPHTD